MIGSAPARRLPNWIDSFIRYSSSLQSPNLFRKWAGIGIVSAIMERRVWARTKGSNLWPNTYTVLVGPPGVGKSQILSLAENTLRKIPNIFVAPSSLTTASMIDTMVLAKRNITTPGFVEPVQEYNSLQTIASELGVFLPAYDPPFMNTLTKLYDGEHYEERRRTGKVEHVILEKPILSILGGTTPSYLNSFLPEGAWDQGFTSRTMFIYSADVIHQDIFDEGEEDDYRRELYNDLIADLKQMSNTFGRVEWSADCKAALSEWNSRKLPPIPNHPKLTHYNTRRLAHCIKLCIISSMSRSSDRFITVEDFETARAWLLEAEESMNEIFDSMAYAGEGSVINDTWHFISKVYHRDGKKPVGEHLIYAYLRDRMPSHNIAKTIEVMVRSKDIQMVGINGLAAYIPLIRH